jgi:hypothetical protein
MSGRRHPFSGPLRFRFAALTGPFGKLQAEAGTLGRAQRLCDGDLKKDEPALVSAADGAGSAMPGLGCGGDQARAGLGRSCNHVDSIAAQ